MLRVFINVKASLLLRASLLLVVGDSGAVAQAGLYFEIRRRAIPLDPAKWCIYPNSAYSFKIAAVKI